MDKDALSVLPPPVTGPWPALALGHRGESCRGRRRGRPACCRQRGPGATACCPPRAVLRGWEAAASRRHRVAAIPARAGQGSGGALDDAAGGVDGRSPPRVGPGHRPHLEPATQRWPARPEHGEARGGGAALAPLRRGSAVVLPARGRGRGRRAQGPHRLVAGRVIRPRRRGPRPLRPLRADQPRIAGEAQGGTAAVGAPQGGAAAPAQRPHALQGLHLPRQRVLQCLARLGHRLPELVAVRLGAGRSDRRQ